MEVFQKLNCPICGGDLDLIADKQYKCKYCGNVFERIEQLTNDDIINLNRAETERRRIQFDDALDSYEQVLQSNPNNEIALWGAFLSDYGVEYVKDYNGEFKPTCHRTSDRPVTQNKYYKRLPDSYKEKAKAIEEIRKEIIAQMKGLEKFDVFICYKSKESDGRTPTREAKLAYNIYNELYRERPSVKVFFAEETLNLNNAKYEPQIFNALKTSKLMVVVGRTLENVNAPWVKNEWKRFYEMSKIDKEKVIRVVYQDIEPYDFPRELQACQMIDNERGRTISLVLSAVDEIFGQKVEEDAPSLAKTKPQPFAPQKDAPKTSKTQPKPIAPKPSVKITPVVKK